MILHTVAFTLKHEWASVSEAEFLSEAQILAKIPGVQNFECLRQVGKKAPYRFALSMCFVDEQSYEAYNQHPDHIRFVEQRWMKEVDEFLELDYSAYL